MVSLLPLTVSLAATPTSLDAGGTVTATVTFTPGLAPNHPNYQFTSPTTLYDNGVAVAQQQVPGNSFSFTTPALTVGTIASLCRTPAMVSSRQQTRTRSL